MRKANLLLLFVALTINSLAQSDGDHINRSKFCIIKTGIEVNDSSKIKLSELKSVDIIKQQYGSNCVITKYIDVLTDKPSSRIKYTDGLDIEISDKPGTISFSISSDKYTAIAPTRK